MEPDSQIILFGSACGLVIGFLFYEHKKQLILDEEASLSSKDNASLNDLESVRTIFLLKHMGMATISTFISVLIMKEFFGRTDYNIWNYISVAGHCGLGAIFS